MASHLKQRGVSRPRCWPHGRRQGQRVQECDPTRSQSGVPRVAAPRWLEASHRVGGRSIIRLAPYCFAPDWSIALSRRSFLRGSCYLTPGSVPRRYASLPSFATPAAVHAGALSSSPPERADAAINNASRNAAIALTFVDHRLDAAISGAPAMVSRSLVRSRPLSGPRPKAPGS